MPFLRSASAPVRAIVETVLTLLVAGLIAYVTQAFIVKPYRVPSGSMLPTLAPGDRVLADRISLRFGDPHRYQIVVFHPPSCKPGFGEDVCTTTDVRRRVGASDTTFIKRVVGLPGETLYADARGRVWAKPPGEKAVRLDESYLDGETTSMERVKVPEGYYFMMGDNRALSDDSRKWGPLERDEIIGVARARYWPIDRRGTF
jgi:signal peptidase I